MKRKIIYVAHRVRGDFMKNIRIGQNCIEFVVDQGYTPLAPAFMLKNILNDEIPDHRRKIMEIDLHLLTDCADELWAFVDERGISEGMQKEINTATNMNISVRFYSLNERGEVWQV